MNLPEQAQVKRDGELQRIESAKAFRYAVLDQEFPCAVKLAFVDRRGNKKALLCYISAEPTAGCNACSSISPIFVLMASTDSNSIIERCEIRDRNPDCSSMRSMNSDPLSLW